MTIAVCSSESTDIETAIPRKREAVQTHCIDDEAMLYDPRTSATFLLNAMALNVWNCCNGRTTRSCALAMLTKRYEVENTTALGHLRQLLTMFQDAGLLVESEYDA